MLSELRQFERNRKAEGLPFDVKFVPERWADQDHLAAEYEDNAQAAEGEQKAKRMSSAKPSASVKLVTMKHLDWVIEMIGGEIGKHVKQLEDQNAKLEARVAELERLPFEFAGTWQQGKSYRRGQFVSWQGAHGSPERRATSPCAARPVEMGKMRNEKDPILWFRRQESHCLQHYD